MNFLTCTRLIIRVIWRHVIRAIKSIQAIKRQAHQFVITNPELREIADQILRGDELDINFLISHPIGLVKMMTNPCSKEQSRSDALSELVEVIRDLDRQAESSSIFPPHELDEFVEEVVVLLSGSDFIFNMDGTVTIKEWDADPDWGDFPLPPRLEWKDEREIVLEISDVSEMPCCACGTTNWRTYPDGGGEFCATCHPKPFA